MCETRETGLRLFQQKDQSLWMFMLVLMLILLGLFLPVSVKTWSGFGIKTGIFMAVFFLLYFFWFSPMTGFQMKKEPAAGNPETNAEPSEEVSQVRNSMGEAFSWFYHTFLSIVREATAASVIGLYLRREDHLELLYAESDSRSDYPPALVHEGSLIHGVTVLKNAVCEGTVPSGTFISGIDDCEVRSFTGVPLIIDNRITGVLAAGSEATEHFGEDDVDLLERCGELISQVMPVYHRAWRHEIKDSLYHIQLEIEQVLRAVESEEQAFQVFTQGLMKLFSFDRCVLCYMEGHQGIIRQVFGQIDHLDQGFRFPLDEGLTGWVMKRNSPLLVEDIQEGSYIRPRYYAEEDSKHGMRSFLGVPLGGSQAWGCVCIESKRVAHYRERDKNGLLTVIPFFELTLRRLRLQEQLKPATE